MAKKLGAQTKGTGRAALQFGGVPPVGGVGTARRDMRSGYYPDDMGMRGGPMYEKGGRVGLRDRAFKKGGRVALKKGSKGPRRNPKWPKGYDPKKQQDPKTFPKKLPKPK